VGNCFPFRGCLCLCETQTFLEGLGAKSAEKTLQNAISEQVKNVRIDRVFYVMKNLEVPAIHQGICLLL